MKKKLLSMLLVVLMVASVMPLGLIGAFAADSMAFEDFKAEVEAGGTVYVSGNITITDTIYIYDDVTIIPQGNVTLKRGQDFTGAMFKAENRYSNSGETLTFGEENMAGSLVLDGGAEEGIIAQESLIYAYNLNLYRNVTLKNNHIVKEDENVYGGAVYCYNQLYINGATIQNNKVQVNIKNNECSAYGGGIYMYEYGKGYVNIYGATINNNTAIVNMDNPKEVDWWYDVAVRGGGIYCINNSVYINDTTIQGNGAYITAENVDVNDSYISINAYGGGIYCESWNNSSQDYYLNLQNTNIIGNTAKSVFLKSVSEDVSAYARGGGIYVRSDDFDMYKVTVQGNEAYAECCDGEESYAFAEGAGVYAVIEASGGTFSQKPNATEIEMLTAEVRMDACDILNNKITSKGYTDVSGYGAGISIDDLSGSADYVTGNTNYGSYWYLPGRLEITDTKITGNTINLNVLKSDSEVAKDYLGINGSGAGLYFYDGNLVDNDRLLTNQYEIDIDNSVIDENEINVQNDASNYTSFYSMIQSAGIDCGRGSENIGLEVTLDGGTSVSKNSINCNGESSGLIVLGAGITLIDASKLRLNNCKINENSGATYGGAVVNYSSTESKTKTEIIVNAGTEIKGNSAKNGGAIAFTGDAELILNGGDISGNNAKIGKGIFALDSEDFYLMNYEMYFGNGSKLNSWEDLLLKMFELEIGVSVSTIEDATEILLDYGYIDENMIEEILEDILDDYSEENGIWIIKDGERIFVRSDDYYSWEWENEELITEITAEIAGAKTCEELVEKLKMIEALEIEGIEDLINFYMVEQFGLLIPHIEDYVTQITINKNGKLGTNDDIYLGDGVEIVVNAEPKNDFVATITPEIYEDGVKLVNVNYDNADLEALAKKFKVTNGGLIPSAQEADYLVLVLQYEVNFVDENGNSLGETQVILHGNAATAPTAPEKEGHNFLYWADENGEQVDVTNIVKGGTLHPVYQINEYAVTFIDGETTVSKQQIKHGEKAEKPADPQKVGHEFLGWFDEDGNKVNADEMIVKSELTLTARYEALEYTVNFINEDVIETKEVVYGEKVDVPQGLEKEGHKFLGWFDEDGNKVVAPQLVITADVTLTAKYEINKYTVKFYDADSTFLHEEVVEHGKGVKIAPIPPQRADGKVFVGWSGGDIGCVRSDLILVAQYEDAGCNVRFDKSVHDHANGDIVVEESEILTVVRGTVIKVPTMKKVIWQNCCGSWGLRFFIGWENQNGQIEDLGNKIIVNSSASYSAKYVNFWGLLKWAFTGRI